MSLKLERSIPPEWLLEGLSPFSHHVTKTITVDPAQINHFIGLIYDQQEQLCMHALPIARNDYIRMCQTLLLKRVQDVHQRCFNTRADGLLRMMCPDALLAGDVVPIDQCGFRLGGEQCCESIRLAYVGSAVLAGPRRNGRLDTTLTNRKSKVEDQEDHHDADDDHIIC